MLRVSYKDGKQVIEGYSTSELSKIKESLTFPNPAYEQMLRYSKWGVPKYVSKCLTYYKLDNSITIRDGVLKKNASIEVPMGYKIPIPYELTGVDDRVKLDISYPPFLLELRDVQKDAAESYLKKDSVGSLILKTGSGKSILGLYLAGKLKQRVLVIVNKDDLIEGWKKDAKLCYGDIEVGLIKGKAFNIGEQITLTTIQTLSKLGEEKIKKVKESFSMLIADECHRVGARSYLILNSLPTYYRLGLTATKMRNDGLVDVLDLLCGETLFDDRDVESDVIIPAKDIIIYRKDSHIIWKPAKRYYHSLTKQPIGDIKIGDVTLAKYSPAWYAYVRERVKEGRYAESPLRVQEAYSMIAEDETFNSMVAFDVWQAYIREKSCVVFCKTVDQLNFLYDKLLNLGCVKIQKFHGTMNDSKEEVLRRAESKEVLVTLATIAIACEGTNVKSWECGFLASSVANEKDLIQILGRLRRVKEGKEKIHFFDYRHPYMVGISRHGAKRDEWYKNLGIDK